MASPAYVKKSFNAAKKGSLPELRQLVQMSHLIHSVQLQDVLELYLGYICEPKSIADREQPRISSTKLILDDVVVSRAALATAGLRSCLDNSHQDVMTRKTWISLLQTHWEHLKYWLRYFTQHYKFSGNVDPEILLEYDCGLSPESLASRLLHSLVFNKVPDIAAVAHRDPFVLKLLTYLWLRQDDTIPPRRTRSTCERWICETSTFVSDALSHLLAGRPSNLMKPFFDTFDNDFDFLAVSTLQRLSIAIRADSLDDTLTYSAMVHTLVVPPSSDEKVRLAFLRNGVTKIISESLRFLVNRYDTAKAQGKVLDENICWMISICNRMPLTLPVAKQAFHSDFLGSVVYFTTKHVEDKENREIVNETLQNWLPRGMLTYHVLEEIVNACNRLCADGRMDWEILTTKGLFASAWCVFRDNIVERHAAQCLFDRDRAIARLRRSCDQCNKTCPLGKPTICSGCRLKRYCSLECQTSDWIDGQHRTECSVSGNQAQECRYTALDSAFLKHLITTDIIHALPGVRKLILGNHPDAKTEDVAFSVEYPKTGPFKPQMCALSLNAEVPEIRKRKVINEAKANMELMPLNVEETCTDEGCIISDSIEKCPNGKEGIPANERKTDEPLFVLVSAAVFAGPNVPKQPTLIAIDITNSVLTVKRAALKNRYAGTIPSVKRIDKLLTASKKHTSECRRERSSVLETEDWDEVGEVLARAELAVKREGWRGGISALDIRIMEQVIMEMEQEMGWDWNELFQ